MSARLTYLDTSALVRRAQGMALNQSQREILIAPQISKILEDSSRQLGCSETTLIEFHDVLTRIWRTDNLPDCDEAWWKAARADLFSRLSDGSIEVVKTPPRAYEHAMALVTSGTRDYGRALGAWDALHMVVAAAWAEENKTRVEIITSDDDFSTILEFAGLVTLVEVVNLDVLAGTGEGADKRG